MSSATRFCPLSLVLPLAAFSVERFCAQALLLFLSGCCVRLTAIEQPVTPPRMMFHSAQRADSELAEDVNPGPTRTRTDAFERVRDDPRGRNLQAMRANEGLDEPALPFPFDGRNAMDEIGQLPLVFVERVRGNYHASTDGYEVLKVQGTLVLLPQIIEVDGHDRPAHDGSFDERAGCDTDDHRRVIERIEVLRP
jgi:hypothetical protein